MAKYKELQAFYTSTQWQRFRDRYIAERAVKDNGWTCDMCGQTIDNAEDITLHHKVELTPDNVNDVMISLNPDNIQQVHRACHNKHHKHAGPRGRAVYIVYGPPLAGKSSYVRDRAWRGDLIVDMDSLFQGVSGLNRYDKPDALLANVKAIRSTLIDNIKTRYGRWDNAWIIGGYPEKYHRDKLARDLGAELIYIEMTKEECLARLKSDPGRKDRYNEWAGYIEKWFKSFRP